MRLLTLTAFAVLVTTMHVDKYAVGDLDELAQTEADVAEDLDEDNVDPDDEDALVEVDAELAEGAEEDEGELEDADRRSYRRSYYSPRRSYRSYRGGRRS